MSEHASPGRTTRGRRLASALIALLLAFLCFLVGEKTLELFFGYDPDTVARDAEARSNAALPSSEIVLVTITDADYDTLFGGRSPLRVEVLDRVIRVIANGKPRVIGVDLETADTSFRRLRSLADEFARTRAPRIVWAQDVAGCPAAASDGEGADESSPHECAEGAMKLLDILGMSDAALQARNDTAGNAIESGLAVTQLDEHGTVRRYQKSLTIGGRRRLSFTTAIGQASGTPTGDDSDLEPRYIRFHRGPSTEWRLSVKQLLNLAGRPGVLDRIVGGKIVLLGGTYRAARDEHHTPIGMMAGLDVHAQTIDTERDPRGNLSPSWLRLATLRFVFGLALALPFLFLSLRGGLLSALPLGAACCMLGSRVVTDQWFAGVGYFLPFLALVVIFSLYERASHLQHALTEEFAHRIGRPVPNEHESPAPVVDYLSSATSAAAGFVVALVRSRLAAKQRTMRPRPKALAPQTTEAGAGGPPADAPTPAAIPPNEDAKPVTSP